MYMYMYRCLCMCLCLSMYMYMYMYMGYSENASSASSSVHCETRKQTTASSLLIRERLWARRTLSIGRGWSFRPFFVSSVFWRASVGTAHPDGFFCRDGPSRRFSFLSPCGAASRGGARHAYGRWGDAFSRPVGFPKDAFFRFRNCRKLLFTKTELPKNALGGFHKTPFPPLELLKNVFPANLKFATSRVRNAENWVSRSHGLRENENRHAENLVSRSHGLRKVENRHAENLVSRSHGLRKNENRHAENLYAQHSDSGSHHLSDQPAKHSMLADRCTR